MYENGEYTPITYDEYMQNLVYIITHINPEIIVHRISADPPKDLLVAPEWCLHKKWVTNTIDKLLEERDLVQGIFLRNFFVMNICISSKNIYHYEQI